MSTPIDSQQLDSGLVSTAGPSQLPEPGDAATRLNAQLRRATFGLVAAYAGLGGLWVTASQSLFASWVPYSGAPLKFGVLNGIAFVLVTSALLHLLLRRAAKGVERAFADVSERAAQREAEGQAFRQLAEQLGDVFWFGHPDKIELHYVNPAYEAIWGYTAESLRTRPTTWLATVHPDDRERVLAGLARYATGDWQDTFRIVRPDGGVRWVDARTFMARDAQGQAYRVSGISRDVTLACTLEEQVRQAEKMEPIGRLAGGIAHDFNNLLSVILSYAGLLIAQSKPGERGVAELEEIRRACERGGELTAQLLAFSRQQILTPRVLDLRRIVLDMERMLTRLLREDIELALQLPESCAMVHADPSQIEQVVMNLAVNARDAMPNGGKLKVELREVELDAAYAALHPGVDAGRYVMLEVTDTGVGMDPGTRERLFQPFFTTKARGKGTGLGLSTVFGIVKQSRGHLQVESEPGRGTTIRAYLPATQLLPEGELPERETPMIPIQGWETVLLVEDDEQVRGATRAILARHGYRVLEACDGAEASDVCARFAEEIHLLLTDAVMPGISGLLLAQRLAAVRPAMKILFMSGYTENEKLREGIASAAFTFLPKPFTPEMLLRQVRRTLLRPAARVGEPAPQSAAPDESRSDALPSAT